MRVLQTPKADISLLVDTSGKLLNQRRACSRRDVIANARDSRLLEVQVFFE